MSQEQTEKTEAVLRERRLERMGRKGKYCPEIVEAICSHISNGLTVKDSCTLEDISDKTIYEWLNDPDKDDFRLCVKKAEQNFKESNLKIIHNHAQKNWFAAAWLVERKFPDEWALKTKTEFSGYVEQSESDKEKRQRLDKLKTFLNEVETKKGSKAGALASR